LAPQKTQEQLVDKYGRKYNLISFILLRKNDEYLTDDKFYLNDQYNFEKVDYLVDKFDFVSLKTLYSTNITTTAIGSSLPSNDRLSNFINSYNCSIFVYTMRKLLEKLESTPLSKNTDLIVDFIHFLFSKEIRPSTFYLIDGDYPRRNVMHYAARYDCKLVAELIREALTTTTTTTIARDNNEDETEPPPPQPLFEPPNEVDFVLAHLCMQPDFNGNTPIHLAAKSSSFEVLEQINPICIRESLFIFNDEGLNTFLIVCRHASLKFIRLFVQSLDNSLLEQLFSQSLDKVNAKNCLHYACGRGCGKSCLQVVSYLTQLASKLNDSLLNQLLESSSPLVASVYHVVASNLTRLTTLYHLLNLTKRGQSEVLDKLDFRYISRIRSFKINNLL
jgi:ankyrin repeat protein